jgi:excisionase family DNA binding protein
MTYTSLEQLPLALSADDVAQVLGISRANAYELMHSEGFPTLKIGKRMTVPKDKLIEWIQTRIAG